MARVDNLHVLWGPLVLAGLGIGGIVVPASIITTIICPDVSFFSLRNVLYLIPQLIKVLNFSMLFSTLTLSHRISSPPLPRSHSPFALLAAVSATQSTTTSSSTNSPPPSLSTSVAPWPWSWASPTQPTSKKPSS